MDVFYNEKSLYDEGKIEEVIELLKKKSLIIEKDGATWFQTSKLGKEQDRVLIKSTGEPTYRLPDIAYHREKINRGFKLIVDIFGADVFWCVLRLSRFDLEVFRFGTAISNLLTI